MVSHEIGHALGLWHHHQRYDRDEFIVVLWDQIRDDRIDNFFRCATLDQCDNHNVPYDYGSVMHYPAKVNLKFSIKLKLFDIKFYNLQTIMVSNIYIYMVYIHILYNTLSVFGFTFK